MKMCYLDRDLDREKEAVVVQTLTLSELRENARQRIEVDRIVAAAQRTAWQVRDFIGGMGGRS